MKCKVNKFKFNTEK